jgi:hypothetical protein
MAATMKENKSLFSKILTPCFNKSIKEGIFPNALKETLITPAFKQGERKDINNYRPIASLSPLSKIFEYSVKEKIMNYLEHINFFAPSQFGFLRNKSVDQALFHHITDTVEGIENNKVSMGVYIDLSKAFDTIHHGKLINKLIDIGFRDPILSWVKTYLMNRRQRVKINNSVSQDLEVEYGVPQGSVLGPLLFNIYINEIFSLPLYGVVTGYADDTSLLYSYKTKQEFETAINHDLQILTDWFKNNLLHLNLEKSVYVIYGYKTPHWATQINLSIDEGKRLKRVDAVKYLGL